jgi:hypothetical protein
VPQQELPGVGKLAGAVLAGLVQEYLRLRLDKVHNLLGLCNLLLRELLGCLENRLGIRNAVLQLLGRYQVLVLRKLEGRGSVLRLALALLQLRSRWGQRLGLVARTEKLVRIANNFAALLNLFVSYFRLALALLEQSQRCLPGILFPEDP